MKLLVLGGTVFVGRHFVVEALGRGHEVVLFNRGRTGPDLFDVEQLHGDRDGGLDALRGRRWDAVIDTSGRVPRVVRQSVQMLASQSDHYLFVSTKSVYAGFPPDGTHETEPVLALSDPASEDTRTHYGALKALCEEEVHSAFGERALVVRPGLIVGPWDPTDRFTYWPCRFARGGEVLMPGRPDDRVQFVDVRDLAQWMVSLVERRVGGTYNVAGPQAPLTFGGLAAACQAACEAASRITWVDDAFLLGEGVTEYMDLPLWYSRTRNRPGFMRLDASRAIAQGLRFRALTDTVADTLAWRRATDSTMAAGLSPEAEVRILRHWHETTLRPRAT